MYERFQQAFSVIEGVADDEWILDSGSSQHLSGDKSLFEILEMFGGPEGPRDHVRGEGDRVSRGKRHSEAAV